MKKIALVLLLAVVCFQFSSCSKSNELDYAAQLAKDVATIDAYLADHHITAVQDSSGARYTTQHLGLGVKPIVDGKVSVRFTGTLLNGQPAENSSGITVYLRDLIPGWRIILPKITKGSKFTLYLPSGLAYGPGGSSSIPGNANLIYEVELLDDDIQLAADVALIDAYLDSIAAVDVHTDPSGLRYTFTGDPGTGPKPTSTNTVVITYSGKFLKGGHVFDSATQPTPITLSQVIEGFSIGLPLIPVGSTIELYIPSGLGYGAGGTLDGIIPANANLIFTIHLVAIN